MQYVNNNLILFNSHNLNIRFHPNQNIFDTALKNDIKYSLKNNYSKFSLIDIVESYNNSNIITVFNIINITDNFETK